MRGASQEVAAGLLAAGASGSLRDDDGCTPLHYAAQLGDPDIFTLVYAQLAASSVGADEHGVDLPDAHGFAKRLITSALQSLCFPCCECGCVHQAQTAERSDGGTFSAAGSRAHGRIHRRARLVCGG